MSNWEKYYEAVGETPNPFVAQTLKTYPTIGRDAALDLGAGNLRDALFLRAQGFAKVVAIDPHSKPPTLEGIEFHRMLAEQYIPPPASFDFALCYNTFFFIEKSQTLLICERVMRGLRSGGILICNVLGERDQWVESGRAGFSPYDITALTWQHNMLSKHEHEYSGTVASGQPKYWHTWDLVFQKT